ncbi:MAG: sodium/proline symporter [Kangiellaceae bacterium]|jgi:sodium/proline symporter|nr:sodium/proline symporter [Kangiellaceae bacterium]
MADATIVLITLIIYKITLLAIGFWASKRNQSTSDFFLGGRQLGPWVAAISASASSSSAWTLLGVSGAAYLWGFSAIWLFPSVMAGFLVNWLWLAPKLRQLSISENAITVTDLLVANPNQQLATTIRRAATLIITFSFTFYIAAQFKGAGNSFTSVFDMNFTSSIVLGAAIIMLYTLLGGFWAVSVTDTLQGLLMAVTSLILPVAALMAVGGFDGLIETFREVSAPGYGNLFGQNTGIAAAGFALGIMGIANGYPGQPHVVNRFMALKDQDSIKHARLIAIGWAITVYSGMLILGWSARALIPVLPDNETVFFSATQLLFSPVVAGVMIAAVLSAVMSTADSQILVVSSSIAYDNKGSHRSEQQSLLISRLSVAAVCVAAALLAIYIDQRIFDRVLFAWQAVGSAFGPILIVRVLQRSISNKVVLAAMMVGFGSTVIINSYPNLPGDVAERWIPFVSAMLIAWFGSRR